MCVPKACRSKKAWRCSSDVVVVVVVCVWCRMLWRGPNGGVCGIGRSSPLMVCVTPDDVAKRKAVERRDGAEAAERDYWEQRKRREKS